MTLPSRPLGYDVSKRVDACRSDCQITVGFDTQRGYILRFLVQLHYNPASDDEPWREIARMDHNEVATTAHNVYQEGLHVDVKRRGGSDEQLQLTHDELPTRRGALIRACIEFFQQESEFFLGVYEQRENTGDFPDFSTDGGNSTRRFIRPNRLEDDMSQETADEEKLSLEEFTELLAEAEHTTAEEIRCEADDFEIASPKETIDGSLHEI